jgi:hypothetical protein
MCSTVTGAAGTEPEKSHAERAGDVLTLFVRAEEDHQGDAYYVVEPASNTVPVMFLASSLIR